jgi:hypothetical protein
VEDKKGRHATSDKESSKRAGLRLFNAATAATIKSGSKDGAQIQSRTQGAAVRSFAWGNRSAAIATMTGIGFVIGKTREPRPLFEKRGSVCRVLPCRAGPQPRLPVPCHAMSIFVYARTVCLSDKMKGILTWTTQFGRVDGETCHVCRGLVERR